MKKTKKEKKRLFVISVVIILLVVSLVSSVAGDWTKIMENKSKITSLNKQYNDLLSEEENKCTCKNTCDGSNICDHNIFGQYISE